jgi:glycosyltransferase involved in cell wall biosynthesis
VLKRKVKIGVVGYEMEGARSGVGRFLAGALEGLRETGSDWEWLVFFKGSPFGDPLFKADSHGRPAPVRPIFDGRPEARPILWEQLRLPEILREVEVDLLFSPAYSLPLRLGGVPGLLTLHDLSFEHLPGEFRFRERWRRRLLARWGARRAARVLTTATASARDLERTYSVSPGRLGLLPLAVDEAFFSADSAPAVAGSRRPYLLWLATLLPRRRIDLAIAAFAAVAPEHPGLELVIAGADRLPERGRLAALIAGSGVAGRIRRLDYVPEEQVPALYAGAELSFYLSSFEGFGLPPLESLAAGTPAVVAPGLELDVIWPDYPLRAALEAEAVIAATRRGLAGEGRAELIGEARRRLRSLSWRRTAAALQSEIAAALPPEVAA